MKLRSTTLDTIEYGPDDDWKDETRVSLHATAEEGNIDNLKSLLERGMDINARDASFQTPLHKAAAKGNVDVVRLLIERGTGMDSHDRWGWSPLHWSSRDRHLEVSRGSSRSRRKRGRKAAELLDSSAPLSSLWIPRDGETVTWTWRGFTCDEWRGSNAIPTIAAKWKSRDCRSTPEA